MDHPKSERVRYSSPHCTSRLPIIIWLGSFSFLNLILTQTNSRSLWVFFTSTLVLLIVSERPLCYKYCLFVENSGDLNNGMVWYSDVQKVPQSWIVHCWRHDRNKRLNSAHNCHAAKTMVKNIWITHNVNRPWWLNGLIYGVITLNCYMACIGSQVQIPLEAWTNFYGRNCTHYKSSPAAEEVQQQKYN